MEKELKEKIKAFIDEMLELNQKYTQEGKEDEKIVTCSLVENLTLLVENNWR